MFLKNFNTLLREASRIEKSIRNGCGVLYTPKNVEFNASQDSFAIPILDKLPIETYPVAVYFNVKKENTFCESILLVDGTYFDHKYICTLKELQTYLIKVMEVLHANIADGSWTINNRLFKLCQGKYITITTKEGVRLL